MKKGRSYHDIKVCPWCKKEIFIGETFIGLFEERKKIEIYYHFACYQEKEVENGEV